MSLWLVAILIGLSPQVYQLLGGRLEFTAPTNWREVAHRAVGDSIEFVAFVVPRPRGDSDAPPGNVMISVVLGHDKRWNLRNFSDGKLNQEASGPGAPVVVDDRFWRSDQSRTVLSDSRLHGVPYALWDKFAARDSIFLDVRTAIPVAYAADSTWQAHYGVELDALLRSLRIGTLAVFADST